MKSKKGIILLILALAGLALVVYSYTRQANQILQNNTTATTAASTGAPLSKDGEAAKAVFEKSIKATNEKDIAAYLTCIIPKARANTKKELAQSFKTQDITNTIQSYKVLDEKDGHLLAEAVVKSINSDTKKSDYRNNVSTMDVSYAKQADGSWLIDLTTTVDTQILNN